MPRTILVQLIQAAGFTILLGMDLTLSYTAIYLGEKNVYKHNIPDGATMIKEKRLKTNSDN